MTPTHRQSYREMNILFKSTRKRFQSILFPPSIHSHRCLIIITTSAFTAAIVVLEHIIIIMVDHTLLLTILPGWQ